MTEYPSIADGVQALLDMFPFRPSSTPPLTSSSKPRLPTQIISFIAEILDAQDARSTLRSLQTVSKEFWRASTPWLYRTFRIDEDTAASSLPRFSSAEPGLFDRWALEILEGDMKALDRMRGIKTLIKKVITSPEYSLREREDFSPENAWLFQILQLANTRRLRLGSLPIEKVAEECDQALRLWSSCLSPQHATPSNSRSPHTFFSNCTSIQLLRDFPRIDRPHISILKIARRMSMFDSIPLSSVAICTDTPSNVHLLFSNVYALSFTFHNCPEDPILCSELRDMKGFVRLEFKPSEFAQARETVLTFSRSGGGRLGRTQENARRRMLKKWSNAKSDSKNSLTLVDPRQRDEGKVASFRAVCDELQTQARPITFETVAEGDERGWKMWLPCEICRRK